MTIVIVSVMYFFFFKQKTAYEMRISDWSSDVCSSDLFADEEYIVEPLFALLLARAFAGLKLRVAGRIGLRHRFGHRLAGVADRRHHHLVIAAILAPWMAEQEFGASDLLGVVRRHHEGGGPGAGRGIIYGDRSDRLVLAFEHGRHIHRCDERRVRNEGVGKWS